MKANAAVRKLSFDIPTDEALDTDMDVGAPEQNEDRTDLYMNMGMTSKKIIVVSVRLWLNALNLIWPL